MENTEIIIRRVLEEEIQKILDETVEEAKVAFERRLHRIPSILSQRINVATIASTLEDEINIQLKIPHDRIISSKL